MENYFNQLNNINVSNMVEKKNGLSYLSWSYAWGELKKIFPNSNYKIYENNNGWNYFTDGRTGWVKVGVIVNEIEHIEYLPIMDNKNKAIPFENITSFEVNKSIQRCLTKAIARHGLGLSVYNGEDLPDENRQQKQESNPDNKQQVNKVEIREFNVKGSDGQMYNVPYKKCFNKAKNEWFYALVNPDDVQYGFPKYLKCEA